MRRFPGRGLPSIIILLAVYLVVIPGCARPVLQTYPASEKEIALVSETFANYRQRSGELCPCCLDAETEAELSVSGFFRDHTGKFSGYLQAMKPGYLKFIAINPLGQPLFIFITNGYMFKSLNVFEEKAYWGTVRSDIYQKFAPSGFEPEHSYYWLTGRLGPKDMRIESVKRDRESAAYWLQINYAGSDTDSMVLFDPEEMVILRHVLRNEKGEHLFDILYADHQPLPGRENNHNNSSPAAHPGPDPGKEPCRIPTKITVLSNAGAEKIEARLHSFLDDTQFSAEDFDLEIPANFKQLQVK